jgi:hypothetical protein
MRHTRIVPLWVSAGAVLLAASSRAVAQAAHGYVDYAPPAAAAVPALSTWGVAVLALALAGVAYLVLRRSKSGRLLASLLATGLGLAVGTGGLLLSQDADAIEAALDLTSATGGTVVIYSPGDATVTNQSGVAQRITGLRLGPGCPGGSFVTPLTSPPPQCIAGTTVLQPAGTCNIKLDCLP